MRALARKRQQQRGSAKTTASRLVSTIPFDTWMARTYPHIPFERYADDIICHCKSADEARALSSALADRFVACKLTLHPEKTKIVYCKDANRRGDFPNQSFDFLGFTFRARKTVWQGHIHAHGFMPAASSAALKFMSRTIRRWALHHRSDKSLQELAAMYNPCIRGWINYYGQFYHTQLRPTLTRIDAFLSAGHAASSSGSAIGLRAQEIGSPGIAAQHQRSSLIGSYVMATAEHREPCELRGSCTVRERAEVKFLRALDTRD